MRDLQYKAEILMEAIPYIRKFQGKRFVIKYGGSAMVDANLKMNFVRQIELFKYVGIKPLIVHGGGSKITEISEKLGKHARFVDGLRITDEDTMEVVKMVLVGLINKDIVALFSSIGVNAVGISGKDGNLLVAEKLVADEVDLGYIGRVKKVNIELIEALEDRGFLPVIAPVAIGPEHKAYNVNADFAAAAVASYLKAEKLILLTDTPGVLRDKTDQSSLIKTLKREDAKKMIEKGEADKGMIPKLKSAISALEAGVNKVHIIDGRLINSMILEVFTDEGTGTEIV